MYKKILVPLDGSDLAERAIWHAVEVAKGTDAEILLLQAIPVPMPVGDYRFPRGTEKKFLEKVPPESSEYLDRIGAELRAKGHKVRAVVDGRPAAYAILHVSDQEGADLIVMSTHGRSGLSRLVMGSTAESVLRATHRTIMLVKPERPAVAAQHQKEDRIAGSE